MRFINIPPFKRKIEIPDFEFFVRSRLNRDFVLWPEQAFPLVGYMGWPNDPDARAESLRIVQGWFEGSKGVPPRLRKIQMDWARVADIFHHHYDLTIGGHQLRRGGPSVGKALDLVAGQTKGRGASEANLWDTWERYKDVAHLVTAATIITTDARNRAKTKPFGEFGLALERLHPFLVVMLMPDFVLSAALFWQDYGLASIPYARGEPMLDPETLWRIKRDINLIPIKPPARNINCKGIAILNARRAGNRGKSKTAHAVNTDEEANSLTVVSTVDDTTELHGSAVDPGTTDGVAPGLLSPVFRTS